MISSKLKNPVLILLSCMLISSCTKQGGGAAIGAIAGGLLGSQFGGGEGKMVTAGIGAIAGGLIGSSIGKSLDEHDKMMAERSTQKALESSPSGRSVAWNNPDSGHRGSVTPTKTYQNRTGDYCREYTQTVVIGGEEQKAYGKACRKPDGHWVIVN